MKKYRIEDALIHIEEMGYRYNIDIDLISGIGYHRVNIHGRTKRNDTNLYNMIKLFAQNFNNADFGLVSIVSIFTSNHTVHKLADWVKFNSELTTAIKRISQDYESTIIDTSKEGVINIEIPQNVVKCKNIQKISEICRKYNEKMSPKIIIYPEWHITKGIVFYVRETPNSKDFERLSFFNEYLNKRVKVTNREYVCIDDDGKIKIVDKDSGYISNTTQKGLKKGESYTTVDTQELSMGILEKFDIVKVFESTEQVIEDNPYLKNNHNVSTIVAEIYPKEFDIFI